MLSGAPNREHIAGPSTTTPLNLATMGTDGFSSHEPSNARAELSGTNGRVRTGSTQPAQTPSAGHSTAGKTPHTVSWFGHTGNGGIGANGISMGYNGNCKLAQPGGKEVAREGRGKGMEGGAGFGEGALNNWDVEDPLEAAVRAGLGFPGGKLCLACGWTYWDSNSQCTMNGGGPHC